MATVIDCKLNPASTGGTPLRAKVFIPEHSIQISLGDNASIGDDRNLVVMVENIDGTPNLLVYSDIDQASPTHVISLADAFQNGSDDEKKQALAEVVSEAARPVFQNGPPSSVEAIKSDSCVTKNQTK